MSEVAASILCLNDLINSSRLFLITDFQRAYEWPAAKATKLIQNLVEDMDAGRQRYLGTVCAYKSEDRRGTCLELVDGQQRITTLVLAAVAARHVGGGVVEYLDSVPMRPGGGRPPMPRIQFPHASGVDAAFSSICRVGFDARTFAAPHKGADLDESSRTLWANVEAIRAWMAERYDGRLADLNALWAELFERVHFTLLIEPDRQAAIRYFEQANTNVEPLKQSALVKQSVIAAADKLQVSAAVADTWAAMAEVRGAKTDDVLHHVLDGLYGTPADPIRKSAMFSWVDANRGRSDVAVDDDPLGFADRLAGGARALGCFADGRTPGGDPDVWVAVAADKRGAAYRPIVVAGAHLDTPTFSELARRLAGFNALVSLAAIRGQDLRPYIHPLVSGVRAADPDDAAGVNAVFDGVVARLVEAKGGHIMVALGTSQFGTRKDLARLVLRLAASTFETPASVRGALGATLSGYEIEHVFPQAAAAGAPWDGRRNAAGGAVCPSGDLIHSLGNLTLLRKPSNASVRDGSFAAKCAFYGTEPLAMTRVLALDSDLSGFPRAQQDLFGAALAADPPGDWTDTRIVRRGEMLAARVLDACGAPVGA